MYEELCLQCRVAVYGADKVKQYELENTIDMFLGTEKEEGDNNAKQT